jgi:hypothetical protein
MTDLIEKLRSYNPTSGYSRVMREAADKIETLRAEVRKLEDYVCNDVRDLQINLAASQAREKVLRDALETMVEAIDRPPDSNCSCHIAPPCSDCIDYAHLREAFEFADEALAQPVDDTALRAVLAKERERCLKACEQIHIRGFRQTAWECCDAIRALGES